MNTLSLKKDGTDVLVSVANDQNLGALQIGLLYANLALGDPKLQAPFDNLWLAFNNILTENRLLTAMLDINFASAGVPPGASRTLLRIPYTHNAFRWGAVLFDAAFTKVFDMEGNKIPLTLGGPLFIVKS